MNRKLNAAITAGLSLSMVLSSTPVAAIAAETTQGTSGEATAATTGKKHVSFFANGGAFANGSNLQTEELNGNGKITQPDSPVRDGYVFDGWYYDSTFTQAVDFSQPFRAVQLTLCCSLSGLRLPRRCSM